MCTLGRSQYASVLGLDLPDKPKHVNIRPCFLHDAQTRTADERMIATQAKLEALQEEHNRVKADLEFEKEAAAEVGGTPFRQLLNKAGNLFGRVVPRDHRQCHWTINTLKLCSTLRRKYNIL